MHQRAHHKRTSNLLGLMNRRGLKASGKHTPAFPGKTSPFVDLSSEYESMTWQLLGVAWLVYNLLDFRYQRGIECKNMVTISIFCMPLNDIRDLERELHLRKGTLSFARLRRRE